MLFQQLFHSLFHFYIDDCMKSVTLGFLNQKPHIEYPLFNGLNPKLSKEIRAAIFHKN